MAALAASPFRLSIKHVRQMAQPRIAKTTLFELTRFRIRAGSEHIMQQTFPRAPLPELGGSSRRWKLFSLAQARSAFHPRKKCSSDNSSSPRA